MKKVLYLLLFVAACKSSSPVEEGDKMTSIMEQVLNEDITRIFIRERFEGEIEHISEVTVMETKLHDYIRRDTSYGEYLFKDHRLHQRISVTRRMRNDTLTIRYDTVGRIQALIHSDGRGTYNTSSFKYDAAGRRIAYTNRFLSEESGYRYEYNKNGDTVLAISVPGNYKEQICISVKGDETTVTSYPLGDDIFMPTTKEQKYNGSNQLKSLFMWQNGKADYKVLNEYDSHGNLLLKEQYQGDHITRNGFGEVDNTKSIRTAYTYDGKGNWTTMKKQQKDNKWHATITRKITYR